jgi:hypothetical protein
MYEQAHENAVDRDADSVVAVQGEGHWQGAHPDQARLNMGGHPGRTRAPEQARHQLQPDPHVLPRPGHRCS